jgi:hypothetical protein
MIKLQVFPLFLLYYNVRELQINVVITPKTETSKPVHTTNPTVSSNFRSFMNTSIAIEYNERNAFFIPGMFL